MSRRGQVLLGRLCVNVSVDGVVAVLLCEVL